MKLLSHVIFFKMLSFSMFIKISVCNLKKDDFNALCEKWVKETATSISQMLILVSLSENEGTYVSSKPACFVLYMVFIAFKLREGINSIYNNLDAEDEKRRRKYDHVRGLVLVIVIYCKCIGLREKLMRVCCKNTRIPWRII